MAYRWFLRAVLWSCTILCCMNLFMQTRSYRNTFFDLVLACLHIWVCVAYEKWSRYLLSRHWKALMVDSFSPLVCRFVFPDSGGCSLGSGEHAAARALLAASQRDWHLGCHHGSGRRRRFAVLICLGHAM